MQFQCDEVAFEPVERRLPPINGYQHLPLLSLEEAVKPIYHKIDGIDAAVAVVKSAYKERPADRLSLDESAAIRLYSFEHETHEMSVYFILNATLRKEDRYLLKPWFLYLRLFVTALTRLPSVAKVVYRGVKLDLSASYPINTVITWWGFSSTTTALDVLEDFLGNYGVRTIFVIECETGKNIQQHSLFPQENEILLMAGTSFRVISQLKSSHDLYIIHLKEIKLDFPLLAPVPISSSDIGSSIEKELSPPSASVSDMATMMTNDMYQNIALEEKITQSNSAYLDLRSMALTSRDMPIIVRKGMREKQCSFLILINNMINCEGVRILVDELRTNMTLTDLYLFGNPIKDEGCAHFAKLLDSKQKTLTCLSLQNTALTDQGVRLLANALKQQKHSSLIWLYLSENKSLTDDCVHALIQMFERNETLQNLYLDKCSLSKRGQKQLQEAAMKNKHFTLSMCEQTEQSDIRDTTVTMHRRLVHHATAGSGSPVQRATSVQQCSTTVASDQVGLRQARDNKIVFESGSDRVTKN